ncbi:MFS transporter [Tothia fuscella]|uniref:MFS transporter n=1 Tax=Tothia fuscella TaxID=1048955 RepID=A0A9P4NSS1_9PEZI|nr:MFS transporter [Tothia fuscella]
MASPHQIYGYELQPTRQSDPKTTTSQPLREVYNEAGRTLDIDLTAEQPPSSSILRLSLTVFILCAINFFSSFTNAIVTVGLPTIANSISLPRSLYIWPNSVYSLTSGSTLLIAGSVADSIGARRVELVGCILWSIFTLSCGFANTGIQLVIFRAFQGIAMSMHLPASIALIAAAGPQGKSRNVAFGCLGLSQPLGFSFGLVISGIMIEKVGWRSGFYLAGAGGVVSTAAGMYFLPKAPTQSRNAAGESIFKRLWEDVDWAGGIIASAGLTLLAYVLAILSADLSTIHDVSTAVLLTLSLILLLAFPLWMHQRSRTSQKALIPNAIWKKMPFTSTCIMVALSYGVLNSMELFSSLYFQDIQKTSPLFTSLRLLPNLIVGSIINLTVGLFIDKVSAMWLVLVSSILCAIAPLLMALAHPDWSYWYMEFWAQGLSPMSVDVLFTVGILIVSDEFPEEMQALAGAVFNTASQFGMSLGIGVCQVVALSVGKTGEGEKEPKSVRDAAATLKGYQASFYTMFAFMVACSLVGVGGLRKLGKVGVKRD